MREPTISTIKVEDIAPDCLVPLLDTTADCSSDTLTQHFDTRVEPTNEVYDGLGSYAFDQPMSVTLTTRTTNGLIRRQMSDIENDDSCNVEPPPEILRPCSSIFGNGNSFDLGADIHKANVSNAPLDWSLSDPWPCNWGDQRFNCDDAGQISEPESERTSRHWHTGGPVHTYSRGLIQNNHLPTHPQCEHCGKSFTRPRDRDRHIQDIHTKAGDYYVCKNCDYHSKRKDKVTAHCRRMKHDFNGVSRRTSQPSQDRSKRRCIESTFNHGNTFTEMDRVSHTAGPVLNDVGLCAKDILGFNDLLVDVRS